MKKILASIAATTAIAALAFAAVPTASTDGAVACGGSKPKPEKPADAEKPKPTPERPSA
ncbi:MAG: hypothetical protein AAGA56_06005 [Myxococcota bacterium]